MEMHIHIHLLDPHALQILAVACSLAAFSLIIKEASR